MTSKLGQNAKNEIIVLLKPGSFFKMNKGSALILNLLKITIQPYDDFSRDTEAPPEIVISDLSSFDYFDRKNEFSPIAKFEISNEQLQGFSSEELAKIQSSEVDFVVIRSEFVFRNIDLTGKSQNLMFSL